MMELIRNLISQYLTDTDDPIFWEEAIEYILKNEVSSIEEISEHIFARVGACAHWLRPHQTRWGADGGFAAPIGYGGSGYSRLGTPETEWEVILAWNKSTKQWEPVEKLGGKKKLILNVVAPTRTKNHAQAAVHVQWVPGAPKEPRSKMLLWYGFRKSGDHWECTASKIISHAGKSQA